MLGLPGPASVGPQYSSPLLPASHQPCSGMSPLSNKCNVQEPPGWAKSLCPLTRGSRPRHMHTRLLQQDSKDTTQQAPLQGAMLFEGAATTSHMLPGACWDGMGRGVTGATSYWALGD